VRPLFIVNPRSGLAARVLPAVRTFAADFGADVVLTEAPLHATALATTALARGTALIVAVGGDGTLNEVARQLVGTPAALGLIPCGSGNGLGRHLGVHGSLAHIFAVLRAGHVRTIDTGLADGHPFFTVAGLGFEAEVSARFNRLQQRGFINYLRTAAFALRDSAPQTYRIEHDGRRLTVPAFTLAVANSDQYGNRARIAPGAQADDGLLDLTAIPPISAFNAAPLVARLFSNRLDGDPAVVRLRGPQLVVERRAPGLLHTDGETHLAGPRITFSVQPASLRILAPIKGGQPLRPDRDLRPVG
jgi:diacylglycerol kinase family enzyme